MGARPIRLQKTKKEQLSTHYLTCDCLLHQCILCVSTFCGSTIIVHQIQKFIENTIKELRALNAFITKYVGQKKNFTFKCLTHHLELYFLFFFAGLFTISKSIIMNISNTFIHLVCFFRTDTPKAIKNCVYVRNIF